MDDKYLTLPEQVLKNKKDIETLINQGKIDAGDLLKLLVGDETVIVDLAESGQQVEIHLDEHFRQSLATKIDLTGKVNADTVYSNDEPMFSDALETMTSLQEFYQFFYDRRKEPSKTYLIQGQVGIQFDNILSLLSFPSVIGEHKWALLCECFSSEAGGFFIRLSLTTDVHTILYTNLIGGWLTGQTIGKWKDAKKESGGGSVWKEISTQELCTILKNKEAQKYLLYVYYDPTQDTIGIVPSLVGLYISEGRNEYKKCSTLNAYSTIYNNNIVISASSIPSDGYTDNEITFNHTQITLRINKTVGTLIDDAYFVKKAKPSDKIRYKVLKIL